MVVTLPYVPETITVHLGKPDEYAQNLTVPFIYYIKNVASSEIYPTWPEAAIRANIYAQVSYTLNRIFTEWYPSRGYDFDITNSTQFDHSFVKDREIFDSISRIVDDVFDSYIRKQGQVEPYISPYCDGVRTQCNGLSQWGSVDLANQGYNSFQILQNYYGDNIELVQDAPVQSANPSYPGSPLKMGDYSNDVQIIKFQLNRIGSNYPTIPKLDASSGDFDILTERAVKEFQKIFNLTPDGIVGQATWYQISYIYTVVTQLAEVESEGIKYGFYNIQYPEEFKLGDTGRGIPILQYFLSVIGQFNESVQPIEVTGTFDAPTEVAVKSVQGISGLPQTGAVDKPTWDAIYKNYIGIIKTLPNFEGAYPIVPYPGYVIKQGMNGDLVEAIQNYLNAISTIYKEVPYVEPVGLFDAATRNSVVAFQRLFGLTPDGIVGKATWDQLIRVYETVLVYRKQNVPQFPNNVLTEGQSDKNL